MCHYLPNSFASSNRSLPVKPVGAAAYEVNALLPMIPLIASIFTTTPAAITVAADAEAINSGLDARSRIVCDFTVEIDVGVVVAGVTALLPELVAVAVVCGLVVVAVVLGFVELEAAALCDDGLTAA